MSPRAQLHQRATATDPQTWVFPPPGAPTPPVAATSNFGPVHLYDKMVLQWSPSTTPDAIYHVCFSESLEQSQWLVEKNQGQPFTYQFTNEASQRNSSDSIFCHFYFSPSTMGNTVVWEFLNQAGPDIRTWEGPPTPSSSTSTSSAVRTTTTVIPTHPKPTSSPTSTTSSSGGGLSTGASAGIGVGVGIAVLAIVAALFFFLRRSKPKQNPEQDTQWHQYSPTVVDYKHGYQANSNRAPTFRSEVDGNPAPVELGGSSPEFELPSPATKRG